MGSIILLVGLCILGFLLMVYWVYTVATQRGDGNQFNIFMILLLFSILFGIYTILYEHGDSFWLIHKISGNKL